jgi:hypothetical protein
VTAAAEGDSAAVFLSAEVLPGPGVMCPGAVSPVQIPYNICGRRSSTEMDE